jgi:hypothetical protein
MEYIWNIDLPIKIFDADINNEKFLEYVNNDNRFNELMSAKAMSIINWKDNHYQKDALDWWYYVGVVNNISYKDNNLYANVDISTYHTNGQIIKEAYDLLYTNDNSVFYLTPHGTKENGNIVNISNFTLWYYPSHQNDTLGNMEMSTL